MVYEEMVKVITFSKNIDEDLSLDLFNDFFGSKPIYYFVLEDKIIWSPEIKHLLPEFRKIMALEINPMALNLYFRLTYIPAPHTIYKGIYKLPPNHHLEISKDSRDVSIKEIPTKTLTTERKPVSFEQAKERTLELVEKSVVENSKDISSIGSFLSGGVDSSIISLLLARNTEGRINTFSVGFEKKSFDESDKSRLVAKLINSRHHEFILKEKDLEEVMEEVILNFDEPYADSSALAHYLLAKEASAFEKVVLTGDGGDEVFGGYNKYYMGMINRRYTGFIPKKLHEGFSSLSNRILATSDDNRGKRFKIRRLLNSINYESDFYYNIISLGFQQNDLQRLLKPEWVQEDVFAEYKKAIENKSSGLHHFRNIDKILSLEGDLLPKIHMTGSLAGIECRSPFLNEELWHFTSSLPDSFLIKNWNKKYLLKKTFEDNFPSKFLEKGKKGFGVPVGDWLRGSLRTELESFIVPAFLKKQGIFNEAYLIPLVQNHISGKADNTFQVWSFYCFQKWYASIF